jgi:uncharacterized membrane protein HdeD (DUF308 family)
MGAAVGPLISFHQTGVVVIILGLVLLVVGFIAHISILWTLGIIVLIIGLILMVLGMAGREVGGRRHYW